LGSIGIGLIGVSHPHTSARLRVFRERPDVEIVGAADEDTDLLEIFCRDLGVPVSTQDAILGDLAVDAVLVHAKSKDMAAYSAAALEAGKAVLVEKPGGGGPPDHERLVDVVERTGGVLQVGYNFHFAQSTVFLQDVLARGLIGEITLVRAHGGSCKGEHLSAHLNQPADIGGGLWVIGCHVVDLLVHLLGLPAEVAAYVAKFPSLSGDRSREDVGVASLRYDAALASFDFTCYDSLEWFESLEIEIWGTRGLLRVGPLPDRWELYLDEARDGFGQGWTRWTETAFPRRWDGAPAEFTELPQIANDTFFMREADAFMAAVSGDAAPQVTAAHGLAVARLIEACYRSSRLGGARVVPG
jgi:predicted dehydrogenase